MTKKEAIEIILSDTEKYNTSLNYAVDYCKASRSMAEGTKNFNIQVLYILNNIQYWRHPRAKEVRETLKKKE